MYLSKFDKTMIRDMLHLSDELDSSASGMPNTLMFLQSIIDGSNCYVSMNAILSLFRRSHPSELKISTDADVLFYQPNVQEKRRVVIERYYEQAFKMLEQGGRGAYKSVSTHVKRDMISSLYDVYPALKIVCSDTHFDHWSESALLSLLSDLGCSVEAVSNDGPRKGYLLTLLQSMVSSMNQSIETFVASCAPQIEDYWAKFEIYSFEYRHFIRSYAYKILLLIELKKCIRTKGSYRLHQVALVQRPADMFSGRVIRFSRARVLMLLTQLDSVFAHQIKPSKLRSYIELVRSNTELVSSILNQNASLQRVIVSAWNQLMPACRVVPNKKNIVSLQWFKASLV